jgi:hypothetical protein
LSNIFGDAARYVGPFAIALLPGNPKHDRDIANRVALKRMERNDRVLALGSSLVVLNKIALATTLRALAHERVNPRKNVPIGLQLIQRNDFARRKKMRNERILSQRPRVVKVSKQVFRCGRKGGGLRRHRLLIP